MRIAPSIHVTTTERQQLEQWTHGRRTSPRGSCCARRSLCWQPAATTTAALPIPPIRTHSFAAALLSWGLA
jgi:hypothetical protein